MENKTYGQLAGFVGGVFVMFLVVAWISFRAGQATVTPQIDVHSPVDVKVPEIKVELPKQPTPEVRVNVPTPEVSVHNDVPQAQAPVVNVHVSPPTSSKREEEASPVKPESKPAARVVPRPAKKTEAQVTVTEFNEQDPHGRLLPPPKRQ